MILLIAAICLVTNCGDNKAATSKLENKIEPPATSAVADDGIVGEWELTLMVFDRNGNKEMDQDEKSTGEKRGLNYFKFNADETCLYSLTRKSKGRYTIKTKSNGKNKN